jgi:hypothetical protein
LSAQKRAVAKLAKTYGSDKRNNFKKDAKMTPQKQNKHLPLQKF